MMRKSKPQDFPRVTMKILVQVFSGDAAKLESWREYWIREGIGGGDSWQVATGKKARDLTLWPSAAIAVPVKSSDPGGPQMRGMAFATLPIAEVVTGYPIHVNARWALSDNRTSLITNASAGSTKIKAAWNKALLEDAVSNLWAETLLELRGFEMPVSTFYELWPTDSTGAGDKTWGLVVDPTIRRLASEETLKVRTALTVLWAGGGGVAAAKQSKSRAKRPQLASWRSASNGYFDELITIPTMSSAREERVAWLSMILREEAIESAKRFWAQMRSQSDRGQADPRRVVLPDEPARMNSRPYVERSGRFRAVARRVLGWIQERGNIPDALMQEGCPWLVAAPVSVLRQFEATAGRSRDLIGANDAQALATQRARAVNPNDVRSLYRDRGSAERFSSSPVATAPFPSLRSSVFTVSGLLRFCLSDLPMSGQDAGSKMRGVPLLLLHNGQLTSFGATSAVVACDHFRAAADLFKGHEQHLVDPTVARILQPYADAPHEVLAAFSLEKFSLASLTRVLDPKLKLADAAPPHIPWDRKPGPVCLISTATLRGLFFAATKLDPIAQAPLEALGNYALLPAEHIDIAPGGKVQLAPTLTRANAGHMLLRLPFEPDGTEQAKLTGRSNEVKNIVQLLGIPILCPGFGVPFNAGVPVFCAKKILEVANNYSDLRWDNVGRAERDVLLKYFEAADFDAADLLSIKKLPLFEVNQSSRTIRAGAPAQFVALSELDQPPRQLPEGFIGMELDGVFFKSKAGVATNLYASLGITLLSRAELYVRYVFPAFADLSDQERNTHLRMVEIFWDDLLLADPGFADIAKALKCVRRVDGSLVRADETFDPTNPVFREFFPERIPAPSMTKHLAMLRLLGMQSEFSRETFLRCARLAADEQDVRRASALVEYLLDTENRLNLAPLSKIRADQQVKAFYAELQDLPIVQIMDFGLPVAYDNTRELWSFSALSVPSHYAAFGASRSLVLDKYLLWSQRPVMDVGNVYVSKDLREALGITLPTINEAIANLQWVYRQPRERSIANLVYENAGSHLWFTEMISANYEFLSQSLRDHADLIKSELSGQPCILYSPPNAAPQRQRQWEFVAADSLFFELGVGDVLTYCHHVSGVIYSLHTPDSEPLLKALGATDQPNVGQISAWCERFCRTMGGTVLSDDDLSASVRLLTLLADAGPDATVLDALMAPDTNKILRPVRSLHVLDAPWLKDRIHTDRLDIAHRSLGPMAQQIGIEGISQGIEERLVPGFSPTVVQPSNAPFMAPWVETLRTMQFRNGMKQLLYSELGTVVSGDGDNAKKKKGKQKSKSVGVMAELIKRVHALSSVTIVGVQELRSCFIVKASGQDVTKIDVGSHFLVQGMAQVFVCAMAGRSRCLSSVTLALNTLIDKQLKNLQPIEKILDSPPNEISAMLAFLQIPIPPAGLADHLGIEVDRGVISRLKPVDRRSPGLALGSEIAWQSEAGGAFKYGRVSKVTDQGIDVETSGEDVARMPISQIRLIVSVQEHQLEQQQAEDEQAQLAAAAKAMDDAMFDPSLDREVTALMAAGQGEDEDPSAVAALAPPKGEDLVQGSYVCVAPKPVALRSEPNEGSKLPANEGKGAQPGTVYQVAGAIPGEGGKYYLALADGSGFYPFFGKNDTPMFEGTDSSGDAIVGSAPAASSHAPIERELYKPPAENWVQEEEALLDHLKQKNEAIEQNGLEEEPVGINELLVQQGFRVPGEADGELASKVKVSVGTRVRKGYDLVRWGNLGSVAFFHHRTSEFTPERQQLARQCVQVLSEIMAVFDYDPAYVTLFYQAGALSRFIKQKLMYNIWPIEDHAKRNNIKDVTKDPFAYMYFYGLSVHKLGHFHDIVHGTRHDFFMNELRIEFVGSHTPRWHPRQISPCHAIASGEHFGNTL